jgi:hypothetical protein
MVLSKVVCVGQGRPIHSPKVYTLHTRRMLPNTRSPPSLGETERTLTGVLLGTAYRGNLLRIQLDVKYRNYSSSDGWYRHIPYQNV